LSGHRYVGGREMVEHWMGKVEGEISNGVAVVTNYGGPSGTKAWRLQQVLLRPRMDLEQSVQSNFP
jgi:hypothetical protein